MMADYESAEYHHSMVGAHLLAYSNSRRAYDGDDAKSLKLAARHAAIYLALVTPLPDPQLEEC